MAIERHYSIRAGARLLNVHWSTLRRWLEVDLGYRMPKVRHGGKILLTRFDIEAARAKHPPKQPTERFDPPKPDREILDAQLKRWSEKLKARAQQEREERKRKNASRHVRQSEHSE